VGVLRVLAAVVALMMTFYAALAIAGQIRGFDPIGAALGAVASVLGWLAWWFALRGDRAEHRARMRLALLGGFVLGGIGFVLGFFGPLVVAPDANQGPLLGIFITGPAGFVVGTLVGTFVHDCKRRRQA
jgi:hypothetical protein